MKNIILITLLIVSSVAAAQIVTIPDANFKNALLTTNCVDTDGNGYGNIDADLDDDGEIQVSEAEAVLNLIVDFNNIISLEGISAFVNLESLDCSYNDIVTLSGVYTLSNLVSLDCNNNNIATLNGVSALPNLYNLDCSNNDIVELDMNFMTEMGRFNCSGNDITNLNWPALTNVGSITCRNTNFLTTVDLSNLVNTNSILFQDNGALTSLNLGNLMTAGNFQFVQNNDMLNLDVSSLINATKLKVTFNDDLITIDLSSLQTVTELLNIADMASNLTSVDLSSLTSVGGFLGVRINALNSLNLNNLQTVLDFTTTANTGSGDFVLVNAFNLNNLQLESLESVYNDLNIAGSFGDVNLGALTSVGHDLTIQGFLETTDFSGLVTVGGDIEYGTGAPGTLDLSNLISVQDIIADDAELLSIDLSSLQNVANLELFGNSLSTLDLNSLEEANGIDVSNNNLTSINVDNLNNVQIKFDASVNELTSINLTSVTSMQSLDLSFNPIIDIDFENLTLLIFELSNASQLQTLDLNEVKISSRIEVQNNPMLEYLFIKNGSTSINHVLTGIPNIRYICTDADEVDLIQGIIDGLGYSDCNLNTYCSFVPGGDYNNITGNFAYDLNNNGCDASDPFLPFLKLNLDDGVETASTFTTNSGEYNFYTQEGNFLITPDIENPTFFNVTPTQVAIDFLTNDNAVFTQNFCITADGVHPDLEIVIAPTIPARPGFDANYLITYKNKGNQTQSGDVILTYDAAVLDFLSATQTPTSQTGTFIDWSYSDLLPFESRRIEVTFNVNGPTETPAVNIGDNLNFIVQITPISGDELPDDNIFDYDQTVIGSYDPNDITCLEGDTVAPTEIGNYLHYIINFENTGNAAAENVVVKTEIDPTMYDINSLRLLSSSHNAEVRVNNNIVEIIFQTINLESGGHGNILLKMLTKSDLAINSTVSQNADIFFDYNFPILTNDADTTFSVLSVSEFGTDTTVNVYPNPVKDVLNIRASSAIKNVSAYDLQGRLLQSKTVTGKEVTIDLSTQSTGVFFVKITTDKGVHVEKIIKN